MKVVIFINCGHALINNYCSVAFNDIDQFTHKQTVPAVDQTKTIKLED